MVQKANDATSGIFIHLKYQLNKLPFGSDVVVAVGSNIPMKSKMSTGIYNPAASIMFDTIACF